MLLSEVANNYMQMRTFEQRLAFARQNVEIQRRLDAIWPSNASITAPPPNSTCGRRASNLAQTESLIPPLVAGRRQAANQFCILLGMPVTDLAASLEPGADSHGAPAEVAIGIPADLLRRRPDVRRAEREVAAQRRRSASPSRISIRGWR